MNRAQTLKTKKEFAFVYKNSSKYRGDICDICILKENLENVFNRKFRKNINIKNSTFGLSVSKKIGIAVKRNYIKRQLRHICQDLLKNKNITLIVIVKSGIIKANFADIKNHIFNAIKFK